MLYKSESLEQLLSSIKNKNIIIPLSTLRNVTTKMYPLLQDTSYAVNYKHSLLVDKNDLGSSYLYYIAKGRMAIANIGFMEINHSYVDFTDHYLYTIEEDNVKDVDSLLANQCFTPVYRDDEIIYGVYTNSDIAIDKQAFKDALPNNQPISAQ